MNVNQKGLIGLTKVISDLTEKNIETFLPISDASAVDLIVANSQMNLCRLQIKYRSVKDGKITVGFDSVVNGKRVPMNFDYIDAWALYCPDNKKIYYIRKHDVDLKKKAFGIRVIPYERKNQPNALTFGDEFLDPNSLWS